MLRIRVPFFALWKTPYTAKIYQITTEYVCVSYQLRWRLSSLRLTHSHTVNWTILHATIITHSDRESQLSQLSDEKKSTCKYLRDICRQERTGPRNPRWSNTCGVEWYMPATEVKNIKHTNTNEIYYWTNYRIILHTSWRNPFYQMKTYSDSSSNKIIRKS